MFAFDSCIPDRSVGLSSLATSTGITRSERKKRKWKGKVGNIDTSGKVMKRTADWEFGVRK
jgi:hypothetical protein